MKNGKPVIVGIGELLWDILPTGKRAGGSPVNLVFHANQLGALGYAISTVGDDPLGDELLREMDANKVQYVVPRVKQPTGTVRVTLANGNPTYDIVEDVAWDYITVTKEAEEVISRADAVAYGTLALRSSVSRRSILQLIRLAPKEALRYYDVNLRRNYYSLEQVEELLDLSDIVKINDKELAILTPALGLGNMTNDEIAHLLMQKYNLKYFILTAGGNYSSVYGRTEISCIKTPFVQIVDTVGAGASFSGAFLYSILTGASLREAHKKAVQVGAFVCMGSGSWQQHPGSEYYF